MSGRFFVSVNRKKMKKDLELLKEDHARLSAEGRRLTRPGILKT